MSLSSQKPHEAALRQVMTEIKQICKDSKCVSQFFPFGGSGYKASVSQYFGSSADAAACAVQPGSVEDLGSILKAIAKGRVQFGVKCGGHTSNPGFSSTKGIQIYLTRFNEINVRDKEELVEVGAGCLFEEVYRALAPYKLSIVGGSGIAGVGVSGWLLCGGYSAKTSQYGLGIDNIESMELVLPNGEPITVSAKDNEKLFSAIKGGINNFGIVTKFTLKTHPQDKYFSFALIYKTEEFEGTECPIAKFSKEDDTKANLEASFRCHRTLGGIDKTLQLNCVYDGEFPKVSPFESLRAVLHDVKNYGNPLPEQATKGANVRGASKKSKDTEEPKDDKKPTAEVQGYKPTTDPELSSFYLADVLRSVDNDVYNLEDLPGVLVETLTSERELDPLKPQFLSLDPPLPTKPMLGIGQFPRGRWGNVMVDTINADVVKAVREQFQKVSKEIDTHGGIRVDINLWCFTKDMFKNGKRSAWPRDFDKPIFPIVIFFTWEPDSKNENDKFWIETMETTLEELRAEIYKISEKAKELPYSINTAFAEGTTPYDLYRDNLEELRELKREHDPNGVMCLTGGFKIHHTTNERDECGCNQRTGQIGNGETEE